MTDVQGSKSSPNGVGTVVSIPVGLLRDLLVQLDRLTASPLHVPYGTRLTHGPKVEELKRIRGMLSLIYTLMSHPRKVP